MLLPLVLLVRRSPESMGLLPDGERQSPAQPVNGRGQSRASAQGGRGVYRQGGVTDAGLLVDWPPSMACATFPTPASSVHLVPLLVWKGLDQPTAAFFVGLMAFSTVIVRPLTGWLGDRWSKQKIGAMGVLLGGLGLAVLTYSDGALWHMVFFAILFSFGDGINSVTWALVGDFFGRKHFATIRGWIGMIQSFASMPAAVFTGWIYDQTQSYTYALIPFIVIYGLAGSGLMAGASSHNVQTGRRSRRDKPLTPPSQAAL